MNPEPGNKPSHAIEWIVWGLLAITVAVISVAFVIHRFGSGQLRKPLLASGEVPAFSLTNQFAQPATLTNLLGSVWVADVIFSRCPISCEQMSRRMRALQDQFATRSGVKFVSLTADPDFDTAAVLKRYAERHGADANRWVFLTGPKKEVYRLAVDGLKFVVLDKTENKETPDDLFLHSTQFVLVDKHGRIRGYFEATEEEERKQLALAVKKLMRER
jgi:protein SCO1/2